MNENDFYRTINKRAEELNINPLLLLSGIEGLYTFRDVKINSINYEFLDALILTIFALRIGDKFHTLAESNTRHDSPKVRAAAILELTELDQSDINNSENDFLKSFSSMVQGKSPVRRYHEKALEVAAIEIRKVQTAFGNDSIGIITLAICKDDQENLGLTELFRA